MKNAENLFVALGVIVALVIFSVNSTREVRDSGQYEWGSKDPCTEVLSTLPCANTNRCGHYKKCDGDSGTLNVKDCVNLATSNQMKQYYKEDEAVCTSEGNLKDAVMYSTNCE